MMHNVPGKGAILEIGGLVKALVISPYAYNLTTGLAMVCTISNEVKDYPFEVVVKSDVVDGVVLADRLNTIDYMARDARVLGQASESTVSATLALIDTILDAK
ncbi:mRNA-degrading endonuclease [Agarivorans sp. B2Z047]|uniref:type II toxin-antitoxin system PemK/MazF family toxin n=1 Tax=Agarivorans sp. B2Z047 TaxID=2652721 RepID=UPI00128E2850|nr:type II toxin-antitoxin system PemK/MazF family toxin [Agarivorans sp. B2Z047]MPW28247.1 mRNA-degrading endonuclease [Agarivorans sp. B2Z047]UQN43924.1 type II toxin-antitoxin system PemK/MazF family toxin [Agarivorans sp. B2Z047]